MSSSVQRAVSLRSTAKRCCGNLPEGLRRYDTRFASAGFSRRFAPQNDKKILAKTENLININYLKSQNFDEIVVFSAGFENSSVRVANLAFEITLSETITLTLLLVCSFSPQVQKYLAGSPNSKKSEF